MINMFSKTHDFTEHHKFVNEKRKGVNSKKNKAFPLVCSKYLSGQVLAGPDMSKSRLLVKFCMFWVQN